MSDWKDELQAELSDLQVASSHDFPPDQAARISELCALVSELIGHVPSEQGGQWLTLDGKAPTPRTNDDKESE